MRVLVFGSKDWSVYGDIMRNMTILLEDIKYADPDANQLVLVHSGNMGAENMVTEYVGKVERFLRQKGMHVKEEIFKSRAAENPATNDYNMIQSGADYALVFTTNNDKRTSYCIKMLEEFGVPTKIVKQ
jgi:hypothetical protein